MKTFELTEDHQSYLKGTKFYGPFKIKNSRWEGYYIESEIENKGDNGMYFKSYVEGLPDIFQEVTENKTSQNEG